MEVYMNHNPFRNLPSVNELLDSSPIQAAASDHAHERIVAAIRAELDEVRERLKSESAGTPSSADSIAARVIQRLGSESATAVNNCAAATVIVLRTLAAGNEVIVSRGQLIEIGGSFRIPEIMAVSGAILREVGTTNITRITDYNKAIGPNTAALLR